MSLPLVTIGDKCLLGIFTELLVSWFAFTVTEPPGLDLPVEIGLSGKVVLRFGGVSRGKSGGTTGCGGVRTRGPGELGLDDGAALRPFEIMRPVEDEAPAAEDREGVGFLRVGVDGLELCEGRLLSI